MVFHLHLYIYIYIFLSLRTDFIILLLVQMHVNIMFTMNINKFFLQILREQRKKTKEKRNIERILSFFFLLFSFTIVFSFIWL